MPILLDYRQDTCAPENWYICASNGFKGCCTSGDPCNSSDGCPDTISSESTTVSRNDDVTTNRPTAQQTSAPPGSSSLFTSVPAVETIASVSGGQTVFITVTRISTALPTGSDPATKNEFHHGSSHTGAIIGGVVGGVVAIILVTFIILFILWRRHVGERKEADMSQQLGGATTTAAVADPKARDSETTSNEKARLMEVEDDAVQQLDSTMIRPTIEMDSGPVGRIAELPVIQIVSPTASTFSSESYLAPISNSQLARR